LCLAILLPAQAEPPSGGDFTIRRSPIDGGGRPSAGADFSLEGTIGQPDAARMTGAGFTLRGGFRTPRGPSDRLFSDSFES